MLARRGGTGRATDGDAGAGRGAGVTGVGMVDTGDRPGFGGVLTGGVLTGGVLTGGALMGGALAVIAAAEHCRS